MGESLNGESLKVYSGTQRSGQTSHIYYFLEI